MIRDETPVIVFTGTTWDVSFAGAVESFPTQSLAEAHRGLLVMIRDAVSESVAGLP